MHLLPEHAHSVTQGESSSKHAEAQTPVKDTPFKLSLSQFALSHKELSQEVLELLDGSYRSNLIPYSSHMQ